MREQISMDFSLDESIRNAILKRIYEKFDVRDDIDPDLFEHTRSYLDKAVETGFHAEVRFGDPDPEFLRELRGTCRICSNSRHTVSRMTWQPF